MVEEELGAFLCIERVEVLDDEAVVDEDADALGHGAGIGAVLARAAAGKGLCDGFVGVAEQVKAEIELVVKGGVVFLGIDGDAVNRAPALGGEALMQRRESQALRGSAGRVGFRVEPQQVLRQRVARDALAFVGPDCELGRCRAC